MGGGGAEAVRRRWVGGGAGAGGIAYDGVFQFGYLGGRVLAVFHLVAWLHVGSGRLGYGDCVG